MSKYEYEYDENVELSIYYPIFSQKSLLNFVNLLNFPNLLNIESFIIII